MKLKNNYFIKVDVSMKKIVKVLICSLMLIMPLMVSAKDFVVKGKVVNEKTNKLIKGAKLRFEDIKKPEKVFYTTDVKDDGFLIPDMKVSSSKEGTPYKVTIEADGYEEFSGTVSIFHSKAYSYDVPVFKLNPKSLPGVVKGNVISKRTNKPLSGASVIVNDQNLTADENGNFEYKVEKVYYFTPLDLTIKSEKFGYQTLVIKKNFELGLNDKPEFTVETISLSSDKVDIQFKGKIIDHFGGANTEGVEISIDNIAGKTAADGSYHIKGLKIDYELEGKYKVKLTKSGYISGAHEFTVKYEKDGVLSMGNLEIIHEALESPKFLKPEATAFSLRPKFEWQLPAAQIASIESVKLMVSLNKDFKDAQSITLEGAPTEIVFPNANLKRLKPEAPYFAKLTYTLKRKQESLPAEVAFNTAAMQYVGAPLPPSPFGKSDGPSTDLYPAWAQDGKTLYFSSNSTDETTQVFEIFSRRSDRLGQTSKITSSMSKSSDVKPSAGPGTDTVSYISNRIGVNNLWSVKTGDNQNKAPMQYTSFETLPIHWISCAKDGKKIVYCREKLPSKIKRASEDLQIWLLNVNDGVNVLLEVEGTQVKVSPDGEKILYVSDKQGSPDIWMYDLNKGTVSQLVVDPNAIDTDPSWTKDGNSIVYSSNKTGNFDLWIMNIREDKKRPLTNSLADERYPDCNPVTNEVVYCSDESDVWKLKKIVLPEE